MDDEANPPDWRPGDHSPPPAIVAHGRSGGPTPCAECHLFNGEGYLGAASLVGLSPGYIAQQIDEFRDGRRKSWQTNRPDTLEMTKVAGKATIAEITRAAAYFAALPRRPWVRAVETSAVPATRPNYYRWLDLVPNGDPQPIGDRIIEVPQDPARMVLEDPGSGIIDYVPPGAVRRGEALVRTGGPGGQPCAGCHGSGLRGQEETLPLAGPQRRVSGADAVGHEDRSPQRPGRRTDADARRRPDAGRHHRHRRLSGVPAALGDVGSVTTSQPGPGCFDIYWLRLTCQWWRLHIGGTLADALRILETDQVPHLV